MRRALGWTSVRIMARRSSAVVVVVPHTPSVAGVVAEWCDSADGVAVARNGEIVPKSAWTSTDLRPDDRVEIVTAAAGG